MQTKQIVCAHADSEKVGQACEHLLQKATEEYYKSDDHFRFFTGLGSDFVLLCQECARHPEDSKIHWQTICDSCVQDIACGTRLGEVGSPEIKRRDMGLKLTHRFVSALPSVGPVIAVAPRGIDSEGTWILLTADQQLVALDTAGQFVTLVTLSGEFRVEAGAPVSLSVSRDGHFAAIANTYGRRGVVVDFEQQRVVVELARGDYHNEHCKFPVVFAEHGGKQVVIHGADWNRLDVSELPSGRVLTSREPTSYQRGQERPAHYLDYFQCSLSVSPNCDWLAGNGWVWHPVGVVATWSLKKWLEGNVWESEDGPSKKTLCWRDYYWDGPLCWVDDRTIAVWGLGEDDILLIPGVRLFDVERGEEKSSFAGPVGGSRKESLQVAGKGKEFIHGAGNLFFDRWLFSWMEGKAFTIWDISDGALLLEEPQFFPLNYHPGSKEFLSVMPDGAFRFSRLLGGTEGK